MLDAIRRVLWLLAHLVLPLRYRVRARGRERIQSLKGPVLLLPNHPGYIDPVLILSHLYYAFRPRLLLYEDNFRSPALRPLVKLLRAIPIPELDRPSQEAHERTKRAVAEMIEGLRRGENFVLWPAGRVQRDRAERLGAARALTDILRAVPDVTVVLVRTRGVWGSSFTYAPGPTPRLGPCLRNGLLRLAANLLFFMPRRRIDITVEPLDRARLTELERDLVNRWFEAWYSADGPERPTYVPYHFLFGPRTYQFPPGFAPAGGEIVADRVRPETRGAIAEILADHLGRLLSTDELDPRTALDDLGLNSVKRMGPALAVEQRFGFSVDPAPVTLGQLMALAEGLVEKEATKPSAPEWLRLPTDDGPLRILGVTIPKAFVARALADPSGVAADDDLSGVVSMGWLLVGALVMARRFARLPAVNVGLMLPASVACDTMFLGLSLAGKVPVLLNWTTGPANLTHAVRLTGLTHVVTPWRLRDRLGLAIGGVQFLDVEDLRQQIGGFERVRTLLAVRRLPGRVRRGTPQALPDETAAIIFTSGSEKAPKAVPLTHRNILANQAGALIAIGPTSRDSMLSFLSMFHSFGFTVTGRLPLLAGVRVVHHPDPTDAAGLAHKVAAYRLTLVAGTPAFIEHLLERARPGELASLRLIFVGAEKCPAALFGKARRAVPGAQLVEGYGVTECSPVIAANRPEANRPGSVGLPLPGVEVCVTDLEAGDVLPAEKMGMLRVGGPSASPGRIATPTRAVGKRHRSRGRAHRTTFQTPSLAAIHPACDRVGGGRLLIEAQHRGGPGEFVGGLRPRRVERRGVTVEPERGRGREGRGGLDSAELIPAGQVDRRRPLIRLAFSGQSGELDGGPRHPFEHRTGQQHLIAGRVECDQVHLAYVVLRAAPGEHGGQVLHLLGGRGRVVGLEVDGLGAMRHGIARVERLADEDRIEADDLVAQGQERSHQLGRFAPGRG
jgi:long-chain-fatty-acid--[acyl-carrier-protein] ligase